MKRFLTVVSLILTSVTLLGANIDPTAFVGDYKLYLYFGDSKPFTDTIQIHRTPTGAVSAKMHVPNDFDAVLENISEVGPTMTFTILVPKNPKRPEDMVFRYTTQVFYPGADALTGFVDLLSVAGKPVTDKKYIGSFVAFREKTVVPDLLTLRDPSCPAGEYYCKKFHTCVSDPGDCSW